ncbi:hypothetical protein HGRIS_011161 [Hohenbuehelia grisea]|uniref:Uncharacterized protein n=1 Tax=Hohenbuehelia grisea TaxID=104357 RepID=A0ABR3IZ12_9AGAR
MIVRGRKLEDNMDSVIAKQLVDKIYEKRKAALDLEKSASLSIIPLTCPQADWQTLANVMYRESRSGSVKSPTSSSIAGTATAIALGVDVAPYMEKFAIVDPLLDCFVDPENRIRYFSARCLYNIAKGFKGRNIDVFFQ